MYAYIYIYRCDRFVTIYSEFIFIDNHRVKRNNLLMKCKPNV